MQVCKLKDPETGLYRSGNKYSRWNKRGKAWSCLGHLKLHLREASKRVLSKSWTPTGWACLSPAKARSEWEYGGCVAEIADFEAGTIATTPVVEILKTMKGEGDANLYETLAGFIGAEHV